MVILSFQVLAYIMVGNHAYSHLNMKRRNITNVPKLGATRHHGAMMPVYMVTVGTIVTTVKVSIKTSMKFIRTKNQ